MENNNEPQLRLIKILLFVIAIGICYLCFVQYQSTQSLDSTPKLLMINVNQDYVDEKNLSDSTQIRNALNDGGMISIKIENDWLKNAFGSTYSNYGAANSEGYHFTAGALMNYIASCGWTFVQAPQSGLTSYYYFIK